MDNLPPSSPQQSTDGKEKEGSAAAAADPSLRNDLHLLPDAPSGESAETKDDETEDTNEHLVVLLDDVLSLVPTHSLKPGLHDPDLELRFHVDELCESIARGRVSVPISRLAEVCPSVFEAPAKPADDIQIRLPLQKLIEQLGFVEINPRRPNHTTSSGSARPEHIWLCQPEPKPAPTAVAPQPSSKIVEFPPPELKKEEAIPAAAVTEPPPKAALRDETPAQPSEPIRSNHPKPPKASEPPTPPQPGLPLPVRAVLLAPIIVVPSFSSAKRGNSAPGERTARKRIPANATPPIREAIAPKAVEPPKAEAPLPPPLAPKTIEIRAKEAIVAPPLTAPVEEKPQAAVAPIPESTRDQGESVPVIAGSEPLAAPIQTPEPEAPPISGAQVTSAPVTPAPPAATTPEARPPDEAPAAPSLQGIQAPPTNHEATSTDAPPNSIGPNAEPYRSVDVEAVPALPAAAEPEPVPDIPAPPPPLVRIVQPSPVSLSEGPEVRQPEPSAPIASEQNAMLESTPASAIVPEAIQPSVESPDPSPPVVRVVEPAPAEPLVRSRTSDAPPRVETTAPAPIEPSPSTTPSRSEPEPSIGRPAASVPAPPVPLVPFEPVRMPFIRPPAPRPPVFVKPDPGVSSPPVAPPAQPKSSLETAEAELPPKSPPPAAAALGRPVLPPPPLFNKGPAEAPVPSPAPPPPFAASAPLPLPVPEPTIPPLALPRFDQTALQSIFLTDEVLDLPKLVRLAAGLPGVAGCMIIAADEAAHGGVWPAKLDPPRVRDICRELSEIAPEIESLSAARGWTLHGDPVSLTFFARTHLCLGIAHSPRGFVPGVREKLMAIADGLAQPCWEK